MHQIVTFMLIVTVFSSMSFWSYATPIPTDNLKDNLSDSKIAEDQAEGEKKEKLPSVEPQTKDQQEAEVEQNKKDEIQRIIDEIYKTYGIKVHLGLDDIGGAYKDFSSQVLGKEPNLDLSLAALGKLQGNLSAYNPEFLQNTAQLKDIYLAENLQCFMLSDNGKPTSFDSVGVSGVRVSDRSLNASKIFLDIDPNEIYQTSTLDHEIGHLVFHNNYDQFPHEDFLALKQADYFDANGKNSDYEIYQKSRTISDPEISPFLQKDISDSMGYQKVYGRTNEDEDFATIAENLRHAPSYVNGGEKTNAQKSEEIVRDFYSKYKAFNNPVAIGNKIVPTSSAIPYSPIDVRFRK